MKTSAQPSLSVAVRRTNLPIILAAAVALSVVPGLFADTTEQTVAYLLVTAACTVPCLLWVWTGAATVPVLPPLAIMFYIYYALPILRSSSTDVSRVGWLEMRVEPTEILTAAATVGLFLLAATFSWGLLVAGLKRPSDGATREVVPETQIKQLVVVGLAIGIVYYFAALTGLLAWTGALFGLLRALMLTAATVACFLLGHARARGLFVGRKWALALACLALLVGLSWLGLFLIGGVLLCLAVMAGYVVTSKRVPWVMILTLSVVVLVLHAGKDEMRRKYWLPGVQSGVAISASEMPGMLVEWLEDGVTALSSGTYDSAIDRASLLAMLLQAQRLAPDYVSYLGGSTYAFIPQMLVPRFIDETKVASQAGGDLLNTHFGIQLVNETQATAVGWGLIAEAYANFGLVGVIAVAVLLGLVSGWFERRSYGAPITSFASLIAFALMMQLINVELDAGALVTALIQTLIGVSALLWLFGALAKRQKRRLAPKQLVQR